MTSSDTIERFLTLIELCIVRKDLKLGRLLHSRLLKSALTLHTLLANRLIDLYAKCDSLYCALSAFNDLLFKNQQSWNTLLAAFSRQSANLPCARQLFDEMPQRNVVSYNTMISGLSHHGYYRESLKIFSEMQRERLGMDKFTVVAIAPACAGLSDLRSLRQLHCAVLSNGLQLNRIMSNVLIDGYGKCGDADAAQHAFDQTEIKDVVSWTSLIGAYTKANRFDDAYRFFMDTPSRNAVTWTTLISGLEQNGREDAAVELFEKMVVGGIIPTSFTLVSVLSACARLGLFNRGKQVHCYIIRSCVDFYFFNIFTYNALIDMYAKSGNMESASALFNEMPEHDVVSWNSMVTGFAQNGLAIQSLNVFERMLQSGITPSHVTFLGVISACGHAGLVTEGHHYLKLMEQQFGVCPSPEHYSALIDALGRKRRLEEAMQVIDSFQLNGGSSTVGMWGALLGACQVQGNVELGRRAAESLFALEPQNGARYVTLSNIYATAGRWDEARQVRLVMKGKGLRKEAGCSWIEVKGSKQVFLAEEKSHSQTEEIYEMLAVLVDQMKEESQISAAGELVATAAAEKTTAAMPESAALLPSLLPFTSMVRICCALMAGNFA